VADEGRVIKEAEGIGSGVFCGGKRAWVVVAVPVELPKISARRLHGSCGRQVLHLRDRKEADIFTQANRPLKQKKIRQGMETTG